MEPQSPQEPPSTMDDEGNSDSQIAQFYKDQVVFITGGTGFIGKVLLEKLLRSCPGVKRIYLLVRKKRGEEPETRLDAMLKSKVFERLKKERPGAFGKVKAMAGDLTQSNLGFSMADQDTLVPEVSVVFHLAATVKFDDPLKQAVEINVRGTRCVVDLCKKMPNLRSFVHVSTAYSNCDKPEIDEVVYPSPIAPSEIIEAAECMDIKMMDRMSGFFPRKWPNTYTLTKAIAESLVFDERETIPVAIVRPSIVTAAWKEPFPGWVDNYNACTGIMVSCGVGMLKSVLAEKDCSADLIPVDIVANTLVSVAWHTATSRPQHCRVYHCSSGTSKPQTWGEVAGRIQDIIVRYPLPNARHSPKFRLTSSPLRHKFTLFCLNYLPSCIGDLVLQLRCRKARYVRLYRRVRKGMDVVQYFTTHGWLFPTNNVMGLVDDLSPTDKELFNIDVRNLQWLLYWDQYMLGIKKYLFNEEVCNPAEAQKHK